MGWRYLAVGLVGVAFAFAAAFAVSFFDPRTPLWGHLAFGLPLVPAALGFLWAARRYLNA